MVDHGQLHELKRLSARLGRNPLLVQAASGNTSVKLDGLLWIKASGKWLADADVDDILVPAALSEVWACLRGDTPYCTRFEASNGTSLSPSIETAMHAVLPYRIVIHVHSVNAIAWAVREDAIVRLRERLGGLRWTWIPYVPSGFTLAREIERSLGSRADILILGNHGLVVGAEDCGAAEALLAEVERRLEIAPRKGPPANRSELERLASGSGWRPAEGSEVHTLGTDAVARGIFESGTLYPCHGLFLGPATAKLGECGTLQEAAARYRQRYGLSPVTMTVDSYGLLVTEDFTAAQMHVLTGLAQVVQRIDRNAPVRYMSGSEVSELLCADAYRYREQVEASDRELATH